MKQEIENNHGFNKFEWQRSIRLQRLILKLGTEICNLHREYENACEVRNLNLVHELESKIQHTYNRMSMIDTSLKRCMSVLGFDNPQYYRQN